MNDLALAFDAAALPAAGNPEGATTGIARWLDGAGDAGKTVAAFAAAVAADRSGRRLLEALFGNSPFLAQCAAADPACLGAVIADGPDVVAGRARVALEEARREPTDEATLARILRRMRRQTALAVAVADITGAWPIERVMATLSDFADAALKATCAHLLRQAAETGALALRADDEPEHGSGLIVLAVGKLGARELNYSSDIDLIVLYDPERMTATDPSAVHNHVVRLTRKLVELMERRTADGYVFRTDLRLRPDPGSTPPALSVIAAETYYESLGQNWERAALIKARAVAGDIEAGRDFLAWLTPFIWRRHLDFAAIQDIHSIKRQINAHRGGGRIAVYGHNIKLGRGGIREIEFFAQTQQLIWGGREPRLRAPGTVAALDALAACGQIESATAEEMIAAYRFLRRLEHRLQMTDDAQTHSLPADKAALGRLAVFLGYRDGPEFARELTAVLKTVEVHYADLFEDAPALSARGRATGNLVFTGGEPDPDTLDTIRKLGFSNPHAVDSAIRGWHHGRYRATRSQRARELLTELVPALLGAFARTPLPDDTFVRFDAFLARLPAGVQLFSMFQSNPQILDLVAEVIGKAPRLARHLSRQPALLDMVLTEGALDVRSTVVELGLELDQRLAEVRAFEDVLDLCRRWANERRFRIDLMTLRGIIDAHAAGAQLSAVAETALRRLLPLVETEFARQHGRVAGSGMVIVAMGKLGGSEMTPASDLDLVFIYDHPTGKTESDGPRPIPPAHYFARLCQRLISAITVSTPEGALYEVDMRLRPSGHAGPIASSVAAWVRYHDESSWTWEHMALTRARVIAGPEALARRVANLIRGVLTRRRDDARLVADVAEMRARIAREHATELIWDVKHHRGGLVDIEFIAQCLQLRHAHAHPEVLAPNTRTALERLGAAGVLETQAATDLTQALDLWQAVQALLQLTLERPLGPGEEVSEGLKGDLSRAGDAVDFVALQAKMRAAAAAVQRHFVTLIEIPAVGSEANPPPPGDGKERGP